MSYEIFIIDYKTNNYEIWYNIWNTSGVDSDLGNGEWAMLQRAHGFRNRSHNRLNSWLEACWQMVGISRVVVVCVCVCVFGGGAHIHCLVIWAPRSDNNPIQ